MLTLAGGQQPSIGGDDLDRDQVVAAQAVLAPQPAVAPPSVNPAMPVVETIIARREAVALRSSQEVS
jgi:hypothetical protein